MSYISTNLNMLTAVAKKVSSGLARDFNELEKLQTSVKGHAEFTKAAVERTLKSLRTELQKSRPQMPVISVWIWVSTNSFSFVLFGRTGSLLGQFCCFSIVNQPEQTATYCTSTAKV